MSTTIVIFVCVTQAIVILSAAVVLLRKKSTQSPVTQDAVEGDGAEAETVSKEQIAEVENLARRPVKKKKGKGIKTAMKLALKTAKNLMNQEPVEFTSNSQLDAFNILMLDDKSGKYMLYVADRDTALEIVDMVEDAGIDFITGS